MVAISRVQMIHSDECYSRKASCALSLISTFSFIIVFIIPGFNGMRVQCVSTWLYSLSYWF